MPRSTPTERRDGYLDVALQLFTEHGFASTSVDMIVEAAGGSKATLYQYFPAKDALVDGLVERLRDGARDSEPDPELLDAPLADGLRRIAAVVASLALSQEAIVLMRLAMGEYHRFPELAHTIWDVGPAVSYRNMRAYLTDQQQRGHVIDCDTQLAAEHFLAGLVGHRQLKAAMGRQPLPTRHERDKMIDAAVLTFLARYSTHHDAIT